ncbi:MAG: endolytic transglycosylase MltG [Lachnospiraceae bacterium]|nr:endolytic transglycosylase MltG [Lachnospiraceae bacterium]
MNLRKTAMMIFRLTMKMAIVAVVVAVFYVVCSKTFEYGAAIFSEEAMAPYGKGVEVVVTIPNDTSAGELGKILQKNGLIKDAGIFKIQAFLYDLTITPGTYEFSTENNVEDIIDIINANKPKKEEKSGD